MKELKKKINLIKKKEIQNFWENNPLCIKSNPFKPGILSFFNFYDQQREDIESIPFSYKLHEYSKYKGKKIFDIGCGNGYVCSKYAIEGARVYGVDLTKKAIKLSYKRFKYLRLKGNFKQASAEKLPFPNNSFDCVCSVGVLHHVKNTNKALKEIFRILKPGGRLILMFYNRNSAKYQFRYRLKSLLTGKSMQELVNEFDGAGNPLGKVFSKTELKKKLKLFSNIQMFTGYLDTGDIIPYGSRFLPRQLFKFLEKFLGWNLYVKAFKP